MQDSRMTTMQSSKSEFRILIVHNVLTTANNSVERNINMG
jgi:hypothetical protein